MDFKLVLLATGLTAISATTIRGSRQLVECSSVPTNQYCHLVDRHSQMALNIANGATHPGASAVQWEPLADSHDNWRFEDAGDGHYHLIAEHSNLSLVGKYFSRPRLPDSNIQFTQRKATIGAPTLHRVARETHGAWWTRATVSTKFNIEDQLCFWTPSIIVMVRMLFSRVAVTVVTSNGVSGASRIL